MAREKSEKSSIDLVLTDIFIKVPFSATETDLRNEFEVFKVVLMISSVTRIVLYCDNDLIYSQILESIIDVFIILFILFIYFYYLYS